MDLLGAACWIGRQAAQALHASVIPSGLRRRPNAVEVTALLKCQPACKKQESDSEVGKRCRTIGGRHMTAPYSTLLSLSRRPLRSVVTSFPAPMSFNN